MDRLPVGIEGSDVQSLLALGAHQDDVQVLARVAENPVLQLSVFRAPVVFRRLAQLAPNGPVVVLGGEAEVALKNRRIGDACTIPKQADENKAAQDANNEDRTDQFSDS